MKVLGFAESVRETVRFGKQLSFDKVSVMKPQSVCHYTTQVSVM